MGQNDHAAARHTVPGARSPPFGLAICMARARPLSEREKEQLIDADAFPDWDYVPPDDHCPFEYKASDWGDCRTINLSR